ncbi:MULTISPECIES: gamma-glutamyltransferase family protein [unclassified Chelatococcus]|uniref:gamma-glutamyltransferase family protein n=1 Tax=unclassified Chelatococcus TaxID=2638111 RepID=UPI001BCF86DA|nr:MULTISPECIES: gamma-glutamyltransferase family protein [unclassified Chelatococcus]MBS7700821.1 gamma-glutamyltransferase family protein [Chelatococcus sp. YT9]MBX3555354.1 gamma-glutamyltransferase family protein [Chelatococcus sp.]
MDYDLPYPSQRSPVLGRNIVATSQPLAAQAGLLMLARGGNAIDAAIAAAMVLTVVEPTGCGIGSDAFAILWDGKELHGLNASGRAPAAWTPERFGHLKQMPELGWDSVTVPGAVSAWIALWERFGSLPLAEIAAPAIGYARDGYPLSPIIAVQWELGARRLGKEPGFADAFIPAGAVPKAGEIVRLPDHARTLEAIVASKGEDFYRGDLAKRMVAHSAAHGGVMSLEDLAEHKVDWVGTVSQRFAGATVHEIPPNGQGIAALIGLGILDALGIGDKPVDDIETLHLSIEATKSALVDIAAHVSDIDSMQLRPEELLDPAYIAARAALIDRNQAGDPGHGAPRSGGTVYLAAADAAGRMVSFIQSNFAGFGSGVVVPGTGISMQNRGKGFSLGQGHPNVVAPRKRPFHTIIPGFATDHAGNPLMAFGVMGGPMQAQGHLQMALRILRYGQNPQTAADAPRWRVMQGRKVSVEANFNPALVEALRQRGHEVLVETPDAVFGFGGAQAILRDGPLSYVAGSDPRKDGQAVAF